MARHIVIVASPYSGDVEANVQYARWACLDCINRNEYPFAPHLLYPQFLEDGDEAQRAFGIDAGFAFWPIAQEIAFYTDRGWSKGMLDELEVARGMKMSIAFRALYGVVERPPE
jgi:hypothetical protein